MGPEKLRAPEYEARHFDDFEAADLAMKGLKRTALNDEFRDSSRSTGEEANKNQEAVLEDEDLVVVDEEDDDEDYSELNRGESFVIVEDEGIEVGEDYEEDNDDEYEDYEYEEDDEEDYMRYGPRRLEELEREQKFELFTVPRELLKEYQIPEDLPPGVCVMGGTARSLARRMVSGDQEPVRDLDLIYIPDLATPGDEPSKDELDQLSQKYMPDDYAYGHGIGTESMKDYFGTRDLTMNQCLLAGDQLLMTRAAYDDLQENIIRVSYYRQEREDEYCGDRFFLRALLFQTVLKEATESYPTLENLGTETADFYGYEEDEDEDETVTFPIGDFQKAVVLNKAMTRGVRTAQDFTETLAEWGVINPRFVGKPMELAKYINTRLDYPFTFRPLDDEHNYSNLEELEPGLASYSTNDPAVRAAMREYDSRPSQKTRQEAAGTFYTAENYAWMNQA